MKLTSPLLFSIFTLFLLAAIPASSATQIQTYSYISTDEAYTIGAVQINNVIYLASDTTLYKIQNNTLTQMLVLGSGHRFTGISATGDSVYLTGIEYAKNTTSGGAGGEFQAEPEQGVTNSGAYDVKGFILYEINSLGQVQKEYALNITGLHIYSVQGFTCALKLIYAGGIFYAYGYAHADNGTDLSYIYKITSSWSLVKQYWGKDLIVLRYINGNFYASIDDVIYEYDSSFNLLTEASDVGGYNSHFNDIIGFGNDILFVGWATGENNERGAMFYESDVNLTSGTAYRFYTGTPDFKAVSLFNATSVAILDAESTVHIFENAGTWKEILSFSTNKNYIKDLHRSVYYDLLSNYESMPLWITTFGNNTLWGGLYEDGTVDNGYFTMTQTPADWDNNSSTEDLNPGNNGSWLPDLSDWSSIWTKYKWYIIAGGGLFFLLLLSGGSRR